LDKAYLGENPKAPQTLNATPLFSKYNLNSLTQQLQTQKNCFTSVQFLRDIAGNQRY
jgi:hypothetical protein